MGEILLGPNSVLEGLRAGRRIPKGIYILRGREGEKLEEILHLAHRRGVPVSWMEREEIARVCGTDRHQGVVALVDAPRYFDLQDILEGLEGQNEPPFFLLLDEIQDVGNLGSLLRTAEVAGIDAVIIPQNRAAGLGEGAVKSSGGALEYVKVIRVPNLGEAIKKLKDAGFWVVGADEAGERIYYDADLRGPVALVVGGEGKGLRRLTKERCDLLVRIPVRGRIPCLNAGVAAGIVVFEILRQRERKKGSKKE